MVLLPAFCCLSKARYVDYRANCDRLAKIPVWAKMTPNITNIRSRNHHTNRRLLDSTDRHLNFDFTGYNYA